MGEETKVAPRRVVLDTNVVVSALVFREGRLAWLREAWEAGRVVPLVSAETVAELVRVLAYPKFKLSGDEAKTLIAHYVERAEVVANVSRSLRVPQCRDEDDRIFLRLAYAARAEALVTGDRDLVLLAPKSSVRIVAPQVFKQELSIA